MDRRHQPPQSLERDRAARPLRMDARAIKRLAYIDVAQSGNDPWSSSSSLIAPCARRAGAAAPAVESSGSGPSAANAGQASSSSVGTRSSEPNRRGSLSASRRPSSVSSSKWSCFSISGGSIRQLPDMPRWKIIVSPRSVSIRPYLARRPARRPSNRSGAVQGRRETPGADRPPRLNPGDAPALQNPLQATDGGLDFRKLGHRPRYGERGQAR